METEVDNAALRLHGILTSLEARSKGGSVGTALSSVTGLNSAQSFARIYQLFEEVRAEILALEPPGYAEATVSLIAPIEGWMGNLDLRQAWEGAPELAPHAIAALLTCSSVLTRGRSFLVLAEEDLDNLVLRVEELRNEVRLASGLSRELRIFLLRHLEDMSTGLREYSFGGSSLLVKAVDLATGDFASSRSVPKTDEEDSLWRKFVGLARDIKEVAIAVGVAGGIAIGAGQYVVDAYEVLRESAPHVGAPTQKELPAGARGALGPGKEGEDPEPHR